jgi:polyisoprenoid-binding protein YceI/predicted GNAT family acetyltransferase
VSPTSIAAPRPCRYELDGTNTTVEFVARRRLGPRVRGRFPQVTGELTVAEEPERSHVRVEIQTAGLDTGNKLRDAHLRSAAFLDAGRHPVIEFESTSIRQRPDDGLDVTGDLTIHGTTRPVTLHVAVGAHELRAGTEIRRADYGVIWHPLLEAGGLLIGPCVDIELRITLRPRRTTPPPEVRDDRDDHRFVVTDDGMTAELTYRAENGRLILDHTRVPEALAGRGIGGALVRRALDRSRAEHLALVPLCPFARQWLRKHPELWDGSAIDWLATR